MNPTAFSHTSAVQDEASQGDAFRSVLPELEALSPERLQPITTDIPSAVATALGALPRLMAQRDALATLPDFDLARFDKIELYARALNYAHRLFLIASQPPDDLRALQEEGAQLREVLFKDASAAIARGLIPKDALDDLKGVNGYKNTALDLQILVGALQENWTKVKGRCGTTEEELAYADKLVIHLLRTVGTREIGPEGVAQTTDARLRAYTLLVSAYDDARRALSYLRRHTGDADRIAPTLFGPRNSKKKESSESDIATETTEQSVIVPDASPDQPALGLGAPKPAPTGAVNPADPFAN